MATPAERRSVPVESLRSAVRPKANSVVACTAPMICGLTAVVGMVSPGSLISQSSCAMRYASGLELLGCAHDHGDGARGHGVADLLQAALRLLRVLHGERDRVRHRLVDQRHRLR